MTTYLTGPQVSIKWNDSCGLACNTFWLLLLHVQVLSPASEWKHICPFSRKWPFPTKAIPKQRPDILFFPRHSNLQNIPHTFCWHGHRDSTAHWCLAVNISFRRAHWLNLLRACRSTHQCIHLCVRGLPLACPRGDPQACSAVPG